MNDLVVASFVVATAYFVLPPTSRRELGGAGIAVGLALGTKYTAVFTLPVLALIAVATLPARRLATLAATGAIGFALFGSYTFIENLHTSGTVLGENAREVGSAPSEVTARGTVSTVARNLYRFVELPGYRVRTDWLDPIASAGRGAFRVLGVPTEPPEASAPGSPFLFTVNVASDPQNAWLGPLGALLLLPASLVVGALWLARRVPARIGVFSLVFPLSLVVTALGYRYTGVGRFFITPAALTLPLVAPLYRRQLVAALVAAIGAVTLLFALAYDREKPTGLAGETPIWRLERAEAQSLAFGGDVEALLETLARRVRADEPVGTTGRNAHFVYGLYGPALREVRWLAPRALESAERPPVRVVYVEPADGPAPAGRDWEQRRFGDVGALVFASSPTRPGG